MNKPLIKLITLLLNTTLVVSCGAHSRSSSSNGNNYGDISDSGVTSSDIPSSSSIDDGEQGELDKIIAEFTSDLDVAVPSVDEYDLFYEVYYYYSYQQYVISAANYDTDNFESDYLAKFTSGTGLVSLNDDSYYTVEDYGYMFGDDANNPNLTITFYTEEGVFYLTITRADGLYGTLDVSDVDTNWYVDYVNFNNFILSEEFPETDINVTLETDLEIPSIIADVYPYAVIAPYEDENGSYPLTYYVIFEGDQVQAYATLLQSKGYEVNLIENTGETINWDTFEVEEYTYYTASALDINHTISISIENDESGNTIVAFYKFSDTYTDQLTTNTDWSDEEKLLMKNTLGESLPFMKFGSGYELYDDSDEEWTLLVLIDNYYQDLSDDFITLLLADGYKKDSTTYENTCYIKDNGFAYIEIFPDYYGGHYFEIYYEASKLPEVTGISFIEDNIEIVRGASYQMEPIFTPSGSKSPLSYMVIDNDEVATVDENGLVTIKENAPIGDYALVFASTANGLSAYVTFVVRDGSVTGVKFTQDNYTVIPGGSVIQPDWTTSPIGATFLGTIEYRINASSSDGVHYENGDLWASNDATIGSTFTITIVLNNQYEATATVTVIDPTVIHTLNQSFFDLVNGKTEYATHNKTTEDGATYEAQCASQTGIQIRSKNSNSGIIGHCEGRSCKTMTFTFATNSNQERTVNIYGSNDAFSIEDMYSMTPVGSITFSGSAPYTFTYDFTDSYSYIGFRSNNGACYLDSIVIIWE